MDLKNTLAAVSLSAAIIVLWGLFFAPDPQEVKEAQLEKERSEQVQNEDAPKLIENEEIKVSKLSFNQLKKINYSEQLQNVLTKVSIYEYLNKIKKS